MAIGQGEIRGDGGNPNGKGKRALKEKICLACQERIPAQPTVIVQASWGPSMDAFLVQGMIAQVRVGKRAGKRAYSGFKKEAWVLQQTQ